MSDNIEEQVNQSQLQVATGEVGRIYAECGKTIDNFIAAMFADDSADEELTAMMVCLRALRRLPMEGQARVIRMIAERFQPMLEQSQSVLTEYTRALVSIKDMLEVASSLVAEKIESLESEDLTEEDRRQVVEIRRRGRPRKIA